MGRAPCCEKVGLKRGRWTAEEDEILTNYIKQNGDGSWRSLPKNAGLLRCGKSCRLRWINYLRDDLKRGNFTREEEETIIKLHRSVGNKWSLIASNLPGRTDNEVKNYWNSHLSRKTYSFRSSCNGPLLNTIDMVKMANTATGSKRKGGRVSRAVAKKYNVNARTNGTTSGTQEKTEKNEVISPSIDVKKPLEEKKGRENDVPGPEHGEPDDVNLLLDRIFEGDLMDLSDISWKDEKTSMDDHRRGENANESDNGTNSQHSEDNNEDMYGCFSPLNTYFKDDLNLSWDSDYAVEGFTFWDGDDGLLWP